jgi:hypothetical protein
MELLKELHGEGATICMITHDPRYAGIADCTVHLVDGRTVQETTTARAEAPSSHSEKGRLVTACGLHERISVWPTIRFSFFERGPMLDFLRSRFLKERPPMRGTSGSARRSPANPARPGREQRYRDRFVRRGVPEVPLICHKQGLSVVLCQTLWTLFCAFRISTQRAERTQRRKI